MVKKSFEGFYNLALKFMGDRDEAADLTQEVLITLMSKLDKFQGYGSFRTWLYLMVYNLFIDTKRKKVE